MLLEDTRSNLRVCLDELVDRVGGNLRASVGKVHKRLETRIRLPEHGMAISWDDTTRLEDTPQVLVHVLFAELLADRLLHVENEAEHLLGSETVEWPSKTLQTSAVAEEGVAKSRADQVSSVRRHVATLVVTVQSKVETEKILETLVLLARLA